MEIWLIAFIGGIVGSVLMDITEMQMSRFGINSGVKGKYVGRWVKGLPGGVLMHQDISKSMPAINEERIGQIFHFVVGGGVVALFYPVFLAVIGIEGPYNHILLATIFGLLTSILPWFVLMPSFGWGLFGTKAPSGSRPIISPVISHIPYGIGIGVTFLVVNKIVA